MNHEQLDDSGPARERAGAAASLPRVPDDGTGADATAAWVFDSRLDAAHEAAARVLAFAAPLGFCEVGVLRIEHALYEAFVNAVEHGYRNQPGHPVRVTAAVTGGWLWLQVCQRGAALDPSMLAAVPVGFDDLPDVLELAACEPGGRGLRIIKASVARCEVRRDDGYCCLMMAEPLPVTGASARRSPPPGA